MLNGGISGEVGAHGDQTLRRLEELPGTKCLSNFKEALLNTEKLCSRKATRLTVIGFLLLH